MHRLHRELAHPGTSKATVSAAVKQDSWRMRKGNHCPTIKRCQSVAKRCPRIPAKRTNKNSRGKRKALLQVSEVIAQVNNHALFPVLIWTNHYKSQKWTNTRVFDRMGMQFHMLLRSWKLRNGATVPIPLHMKVIELIKVWLMLQFAEDSA